MCVRGGAVKWTIAYALFFYFISDAVDRLMAHFIRGRMQNCAAMANWTCCKEARFVFIAVF
jgi:hypothetical protein